MDPAGVRVLGLRELDLAFRRMSRDVRTDFVWELQEAADKPRALATSKVLGEMVNMPPTPVYAQMKVGVEAASTTVYVAPAWRPSGTRHRPRLAGSLYKRMAAAVEETADQTESHIGYMLDRMAAEWGAGG